MINSCVPSFALYIDFQYCPNIIIINHLWFRRDEETNLMKFIYLKRSKALDYAESLILTLQ